MMKITLAQIEIDDNDFTKNAEKIVHIIENHTRSNIILFPELAVTGFPTADNLEDKFTQSQDAFERICQATLTTQSHILIGQIEQDGTAFYNSAFLIHQGKHQVLHRKAHLWLDDIGLFTQGNRSSLVHILNANVGAQICFDLEFPEGSRALAQQGADLILMPNSNMHPYENTHFILSQARAIENQVFVATCNRVGSGHGGQFAGESLVVSPFGEVLLQMNEEESIQTLQLDMEQVQLSRKDYQYINHQ
ncbi:carbon-nitrogen hydrolase family protein [Marinomonas spartinae]|uniref:carbon-nitrogen hydrolase family protein n=1 Tax=Marinomonas spartinae TaxID=1792290 RepID=UPI0018F25395|nr:nitrilase-related carbon-nitrogen hydrolase [Marinomonas spartinae]MBJ7555509.1 hypothetical protein [Marinomonas spartinae]